MWDKQKVNFDEVKELATTIAKAMSRADDQSIITAMEASTNTMVAATLDLAAITGASMKLNEVGVPAEDRYFVTDEVGLNDILNDATITSADYNSVRLLQSGEIDSFMGFKWKLVNSGRVEGGLSDVSYAFHKAAIGHAVGIDIQTKVDYVPHKGSWLSLGIWSAGSALIDTEGCVKITKV